MSKAQQVNEYLNMASDGATARQIAEAERAGRITSGQATVLRGQAPR